MEVLRGGGKLSKYGFGLWWMIWLLANVKAKQIDDVEMPVISKVRLMYV